MPSFRSCAIALALLFGATASYASPISFTETATGSGSLNGATFSGQLITLTGVADTANITEPYPGVYLLALTSDTLQIGTGAVVTFTDPISVFANDGVASVGFVDPSLGLDIINVADAAFSGYELDSAIGATGTGTASNFESFGTSAGDFLITGLEAPATFTAVTSTPEPSSLILLGTGVLGIAARVRRRRAKQ